MRRGHAQALSRFPSDSCWPTEHQTHLLQAALLTGPRARAALQAWKREARLDQLDRGSARLLPLLSLNKKVFAPDDSLWPRLAASYERATANTTSLLQAVALVVGALRRASIETVILKGVAIAVEWYPAPGARPMDDCDLLVRPSDVAAASRVLAGEGWRLKSPLNPDVVAVGAEANFIGPAGHRLDLHWHVQRECADPASDAEFWAATKPLVVAGEPTRRLGTTDMLIHVCVHGLCWSTIPPVRWVADAMMMLRSAGSEVDWPALVDRATRRRVTVPMHDCLKYLQVQFDAPVPAEVISQLSRVRTSWATRLEYRAKMRRRTATRLAVVHWFQLRRLRGRGGVVGDVFRFPRYLGQYWGLRSPVDIGRRIITKISRRHELARPEAEP